MQKIKLTIDDMASLFEKSRSIINEHILNIFEEDELEKENVVRKIGNSDFSTIKKAYIEMIKEIRLKLRIRNRKRNIFYVKLLHKK